VSLPIDDDLVATYSRGLPRFEMSLLGVQDRKFVCLTGSVIFDQHIASIDTVSAWVRRL